MATPETMGSENASPSLEGDQIGVPRVLAEHQTPSQKATFKRFYPSGLPLIYPMHDADPESVSQTYVEDNFSISFYATPPSNARAIFSTNNGHQPLRSVYRIKPRRLIHLWSKDEIQGICNSMRKVWWAFMKILPKPQSWDDLWTYFDAHDIYFYGALNLWNVLNTLYDENVLILADLHKEIGVWVGHWADEWLENPANQTKLGNWSDGQGYVLDILTDEDWNLLGGIDEFAMSTLESALKHRRNLPSYDSYGGKPKDLVSVLDNDLHNWLGKLYSMLFILQK